MPMVGRGHRADCPILILLALFSLVTMLALGESRRSASRAGDRMILQGRTDFHGLSEFATSSSLASPASHEL
jgi:hypothetical protein